LERSDQHAGDDFLDSMSESPQAQVYLDAVLHLSINEMVGEIIIGFFIL
jgi:hypothetical protein